MIGGSLCRPPAVMLDGMGRDDMRAADGDRQQVADRLRAALDEGRLDLHEYDERLQRAYAAKTYGELDTLLTDLPATVPAQQSRVVPFGGAVPASVPAGSAGHPDATRRWLVETWNGYAGVVAICLAIWLVTCVLSTELLYFWPVWVAGPWGAVLVWQTVAGLSSGEPERWATKQERERLAKERGAAGPADPGLEHGETR
jgi:hypothetical protein